MSGPAKKAAEAVTKFTIKGSGVIPTKKAADTVTKFTIKGSGSKTHPAQGTNTTMMPWNNWFSSFLKSKLGPERYEKLRSLVLWDPKDLYDLEQVPRPSTKIPISREDPTKTTMFRYPSPGSQPPVNLPEADAGTYEDDPYKIAYYPTDTRRRGKDPAMPYPEMQKLQLEMMDQSNPAVQERLKKLEEGPGSSPGNKGMFATGKSDFDPTGLRATMSANWEEMNKELDRHMPDHLPTPIWYDNAEEILAWYEERDLPIPLGGHGTSCHVPREKRIARW